MGGGGEVGPRRPPDLSLTYSTPPGGQQRSQMARATLWGERVKKISANLDDRAHFLHDEIKLKELRAIKLPSGITVTATIGYEDEKKKKKSLLGTFF